MEIKINVNINIETDYEKRLVLELIEELKSNNPNETLDVSVRVSDKPTSRSLQ